MIWLHAVDMVIAERTRREGDRSIRLFDQISPQFSFCGAGRPAQVAIRLLVPEFEAFCGQ